MTTLHIDFETRSAVDLNRCGAYVYADDPSTEIMCLAFAVDDGPVKLAPMDRLRKPSVIRKIGAAVDGATEIVAHNANFEIIIWRMAVRRYGWPPLPEDKVRCTMAQAHAMALPPGLADAAAAVQLPVEKDMDGHRLMMQMSKPRKRHPDGTFTWWEEPEKLDRLYAYCKRDVETERALDKVLLKLSPSEQRLWQLDRKINDRGVHVDVDAIDVILEAADLVRAQLTTQMARVTDGAVPDPGKVARLKDWIADRGITVAALTKDDVVELLAEGDLPDDVAEALHLRKDFARASVAKYAAMRRRANADNRVRGIHQYHGADTGRWAGRGVQAQNLKRPDLKPHEVNFVLERTA